MALPKPSKTETHAAFVARFDADASARTRFPDGKVRAAAAEATWAQHRDGGAQQPAGAVRANGELVIYGIIGDAHDNLDARTIMGELDGLGLREGDSLTCRINSPGGYVSEGLAIYNLLRASPASIRVEIDGVAASMGSVLAMAGDTIVMPANAVMMIHNPWNMAIGDADDLRKAADELELLRDAIAGIYARRSGQPQDTVVAMMAEETWLSAEEAVELGFADELGEEVRAAALQRFDLNRYFTQVPPALAGGDAGGAAAAHTPGDPAGHSTKGQAMPETTKPGAAAPTPAEPEKTKSDAQGAAPTPTLTPTQTPESASTAQATADLDKIRREATEAERTRVAGITRAVRAAKLPADKADEMIREGLTIEQAQARVIDAWAAGDGPDTQGHVRVEGIADERDKWLQGAQNAVLTHAGMAKIVNQHTQAKIEPGEFRGLSMLELARDCLERNGVKTRGLGKRELIGRALTMSPQGSYQTTGDFAVLLENTMHKVLQAAYATTPDTWSRFCATGTVSDFRPHNRYRMGVFSRLDRLSENGEFKNKPINDAEKELIQASTFGNVIGLSRQALISDDLSAFNRMAMMLGRAARLSVEIDVYALLGENGGNGPTMNDGATLFDATHNNVDGTGAAPSVAAFEAARTGMAQQKDPWGNDFLDVRPAIWVGPLGLGGDARVVNDAQYDPDAANKLQRPNKVRGLFQDIVDTVRLTGTPWYAFADPAQIPAIEVSFLDGESEPYMETEEGFRVDGVEWKVRHDYAVGAIDWRGVWKNPGA
jgi:ATP-dependent Clp endopeptidase proteolytic subunit ClpP